MPFIFQIVLLLLLPLAFAYAISIGGLVVEWICRRAMHEGAEESSTPGNPRR